MGALGLGGANRSSRILCLGDAKDVEMQAPHGLFSCRHLPRSCRATGLLSDCILCKGATLISVMQDCNLVLYNGNGNGAGDSVWSSGKRTNSSGLTAHPFSSCLEYLSHAPNDSC